jgi:hypothetical protein
MGHVTSPQDLLRDRYIALCGTLNTMLFALRVSLLIALLFTSSFLAAGAPRQAPMDVKQFSPDHQYFLISKVKEKCTQIFRSDKPSTVLWQIPVYIQIADISNDGRHVAASYEGGNILENDVRPSDPLITFYDATGSRRVVTVGEVVGDPGKLRRSTSGLPWGRVIGFQPTGRLMVVLDSGRSLTLDPESH